MRGSAGRVNEGAVGGRFAQIARDQPAATALRSAGVELTFGELDAMANRLAGRMVERLGDDETPVLVRTALDYRDFVVLLALCKAGKPFTAVGRDLDGEAYGAVERDLEPGLTLDVADLDADGLRGAGDARDLSCAVGPERASSIVYTSGSSAAPKGVVRTHANLLERARLYRAQSGAGPGDVQALMAPLSHVGAESDLFGGWLNGAAVSHYPASRGVAGLTDWLCEEAVSLWHPPVGLLRRWLNLQGGPVELPALRLVALGGEAVYWSDVRRLREVVGGGVRVLHRYSSSEAGSIAAYEVEEASRKGEGAVPAGKAVEGVELSVGEGGEVIVRSPHLSRGYWRGRGFGSEYRTGDVGRFDDAGLLHLAGRRDRRVKVRGFLVDLAEVEGAVLAEEGVTEAAVVAEGDRLLAYIVDPPPGLAERTAARLAPWSRPNAWIAIDEIPLTPNGKVDRRALPLPAAAGRTPRPGLEQQLTELWRDVFGRVDAGADDDFFALGGDSLRAAELAARISALAGEEVQVTALYWSPTPAAMAGAIEAGALSPGRIVPLKEGEGEPWLLLPPTPKGTGWYRDVVGELEGPVYGYDLEWEPHQIHEIAPRLAAEIAARWPEGTIALAGYSFAGNLAFETARRAPERVSMVTLIDASAPGFQTGRELARSGLAARAAVWRYMFSCWRFAFLTYRGLRGEARTRYARSLVENWKRKLNLRFLTRRFFSDAPKTYSPPGVRHHETGPYEGRVHVIRFSRQYPGAAADPCLGWRRWARGALGCEMVRGIHLPIMFERPWAAPLAAAMTRGRRSDA